MEKLKGSCLCGAISYEVAGRPRASFLCQCRTCQKLSGSGHAAEFVVPEKRLTITGILRSYEMECDDGNSSTSHFCPTCGSPMLKRSTLLPDAVFIHAASLDDPSSFKPQQVFWHASAQPWDVVDHNLEIRDAV